MAKQPTGPNGLSQRTCEVTELSIPLVDPELYEAIKESKRSHTTDDGDHPPTSTGPSTEPDRPFHLLYCIKIEDENGTQSKCLSVLPLVKGIDSTDSPALEVKGTNSTDDSQVNDTTDDSGKKETNSATPEAKGTDFVDAPLPKPFYYGDKCLRAIKPYKGLEEEVLKLVDATKPINPDEADKFMVNITDWKNGRVGEFKSCIGGIVVAVIEDPKDPSHARLEFCSPEDLQVLLSKNMLTGPDRQYTIPDITINAKPSDKAPPIAMFYYDENPNLKYREDHDMCYYVIPNPDKGCATLKHDICDVPTIETYRHWSNTYSS